MPIHFRIDTHMGRVLSIGRGSLSDDEVLDYLARLRRHPDFRPDLDAVVDLRRIDGPYPTGEGLRRASRRMSASDRDQGPGGRIALVADSDVLFGLSRLYEALRDQSPDQVQAFRNLDEAVAWLTNGEAPPEPIHPQSSARGE